MSSTNDEADHIDTIRTLPTQEVTAIVGDIIGEIEKAVIADREFLELLLTGVLARGHVHLEDVPGTGKTLVAQVLATALGIQFRRIQFTPDLLPADVTGANVYNEADQTFEFQEGPVFANVVLADEINRAPPKTQSALLEAMGEKQVTVDNASYTLPRPFFVIATQNPIEQEGTFRLPEAQRDRFLIKSAMGYPEEDGEKELLRRRTQRRTHVPEAQPVTDPQTVRQLQATVEEVTIEEDVISYITEIARTTREHSQARTGVSPRGTQHMLEAARAYALINDRDYVTPADVKSLAVPVFAHRIVLTNRASAKDVDKSSIVESVIEEIPVPGMDDL